MMVLNGAMDISVTRLKKVGVADGYLGEAWLFRPEEPMMRMAYKAHVAVFVC